MGRPTRKKPKCQNCGGKFIRRGHGGIHKFCSAKCQGAYYRKNNREKVRKMFRDWNERNPQKRKLLRKKYRKEDPEKMKEIRKKDYEKYKVETNCRSKTFRLIKEGKIHIIKKCHRCNSVENLEIHHEVYSKTMKEIYQDVIDGKIYYLCLKHHKLLNRKQKGGDNNG